MIAQSIAPAGHDAKASINKGIDLSNETNVLFGAARSYIYVGLMHDVVDIVISATAEDMGAAQALHARSVGPWWLSVIFIVVAAALFLYFTPDWSSLSAIIPLVSFLVIALAILAYQILWHPFKVGRRMFADMKFLHQLYRIEVSIEGVQATAANGYSKTPWQNYTRWREDRRMILLYQSKYLFQFVPKRVLCPADLAIFRGFAAREGVPGCPKIRG